MKKKLLITFGVLLLLLVAALMVVAMSLGNIIKRGVERVGPGLTRTEVKLASAELSLLSGTGTLKGFLMGNPEGFKTASAIQAKSVSVGVQPKSLFSDKVHVTHIRVEGAEVTFEGTLGTVNNLSKILENVKAAAGASAPAAKPGEKPKPEGASKKLQVDEFTITGAKVNLSMTLLSGQSLAVPLPEIKWTALGTGPEGITAAELAEKIMDRVTLETLKVAEKAILEFSKNAAGAVTKGATDALNKATKNVGDNIGDLLKKK
ncbi:MAG: hypothetical protein QOF48_2597 [Verrucomicrobiota bacterium]|jgi:uncharacterized protein involved in outer membrane biogenesis